VEIPASVESFGVDAFSGFEALMEAKFSVNGRLRSLCGFQGCISLRRVEIPASVEQIHAIAFIDCTALKEVLFGVDSRLRLMGGFHGCISLCRVEVPASTEILYSIPVELGDQPQWVFIPWHSLSPLSWRELVLRSGTRSRPVHSPLFRAFIRFEDPNDLKKRRRRLHKD
jgi:hypothetical protein